MIHSPITNNKALKQIKFLFRRGLSHCPRQKYPKFSDGVHPFPDRGARAP